MINYYQPFLLPFLTHKPYTLPKNVQRYYYYSWEDALWDILPKKNIPKGATILIPDFYCMDVIENIKNHGYRVVLYPLDNHFQIKETEFIRYIKKYSPAVVIIFHAAGITNTLFRHTHWTSFLANHTIIIEDCVQRLVNPKTIHLIHNNHIIMDSLRKDSPLRGSFLYAHPSFFTFTQTSTLIDSYTCSSSILYALFRVMFELSSLFSLPALTKYAHEVVLKAHDDIIGDSQKSHKGIPFIPLLHRFLNFEKIEVLKESQARIYQQSLFPTTKRGIRLPDKQHVSIHPRRALSNRIILYEIAIPEDDYKHLHVYPVGLLCSPAIGKKLCAYLHKQGIIVWNKFPDSPWSQKRHVLFLPLGFHIHQEDIHTIVKALHAFT